MVLPLQNEEALLRQGRMRTAEGAGHNKLCWNAAGFQVAYPSLASQLCIGGVYVRLLLDGVDQVSQPPAATTPHHLFPPPPPKPPASLPLPLRPLENMSTHTPWTVWIRSVNPNCSSPPPRPPSPCFLASAPWAP